MSRFWFDHFAGSVKHHLISTDVADVPGLTDAERRLLAGRIMLCRKVDVIPIECIARGYHHRQRLEGLSEDRRGVRHPLPKGLRNGDRLPEPLFTPSTKATSGHDENISFDEGAAIVGADLMRWLKRHDARFVQACFGICDAARHHSGGHEVRVRSDRAAMARRCWSTRSSRPTVRASGRRICGVRAPNKPSFDKQYVRDYLETLVTGGRWNKTPPGPTLPDDVVQQQPRALPGGVSSA